MTKKNKKLTVEELRKTMAIEIRPAKELKKPVEYPERFDFFMANALKNKPRKKRQK